MQDLSTSALAVTTTSAEVVEILDYLITEKLKGSRTC